MTTAAHKNRNVYRYEGKASDISGANIHYAPVIRFWVLCVQRGRNFDKDMFFDSFEEAYAAMQSIGRFALEASYDN